MCTLIMVLTCFLACHQKVNGLKYHDFGKENTQLVTGIRDSIRNWIKKFAMYPDSYEPESWNDFNHLASGSRYIDTTEILNRIVVSYGADSLKREIKPLRIYHYLHTYRLKTIRGDTVRYTHRFQLQYDMHVQAVDTSFGMRAYVVYPDDIGSWLAANGRPLSVSDTTDAFTPYRKALWALDFEMDTIRDRWRYPGERKEYQVTESIDSLYEAYFHKSFRIK
ncbi:MAG TPA: hypothetical protein VFW78_00715 [Bacteroidia bacterium]|nr:hypothetical protein [Bacteroidia bacterium]